MTQAQWERTSKAALARAEARKGKPLTKAEKHVVRSRVYRGIREAERTAKATGKAVRVTITIR